MKLKEFKELMSKVEHGVGEELRGICASLGWYTPQMDDEVINVMEDIYDTSSACNHLWKYDIARESLNQERLIGFYLLREYIISEKLYRSWNYERLM